MYLWISVVLNDQVFGVGVVSRPLQMNYNFFINELETSLSVIYPEVDYVIRLGDFNIDLLVYDILVAESLVDMLSSFGLTQIVDAPARITLTSAKLIDLIFISDKEILSDEGTLPVHDFSDHDLTFPLK
ncbi:endonuclease/exonuclease/phosphatase superfamily [Holotrichia oblita]|uniref:Endonuclease/exonuclease/phosphatase superfamily n=1 Tax=Holotrichia oblita TaxID=644536 RepID=A0ACB9TST6_HOLOL|nr:endonuclease/exonuclease/phosphatase superfamily [Holotrichia oblita]